MKNSDHKLRSELRQAGASNKEVDQLSALASSLGKLNKPDALSSNHDHRTKRRLFVPMAATSFAGLLLGMAIVVLSQTALPGNMLYPVQKLSDNVAISVNSNYRGTVMMKSAEQVKQLVANGASPNLVLATLTDYKTEASAYKSVQGNYAAFEYCKTMLEQASKMADSSVRQSINSTLSSLTEA